MLLCLRRRLYRLVSCVIESDAHAKLTLSAVILLTIFCSKGRRPIRRDIPPGIVFLFLGEIYLTSYFGPDADQFQLARPPAGTASTLLMTTTLHGIEDRL
jgi:hypothetical protein